MAGEGRTTKFRAIAVFAVAGFLLGATPPELDFPHQVLLAHNAERARFGLSPLAWDDDLAEGAQEWSDHLASTGKFEHSPNQPGSVPIGENIWGGTTGKFRPQSMVSLWIAEKKYFKVGVFPHNSTTGDVHDVSHYTQLVWRSSARVGCGLSTGQSSDILVCRYSSAGNIIGKEPI